jgi:hypothetical protein
MNPRTAFATSLLVASCAAAPPDLIDSRVAQSARDAVVGFGLDPATLEATLLDAEECWNEFADVDVDAETFEASLKRSLMGHEFWAILFMPMDHEVCGGGVLVFVEKNPPRALAVMGER